MILSLPGHVLFQGLAKVNSNRFKR